MGPGLEVVLPIHWLKLSHMPTPHRREGWEIQPIQKEEEAGLAGC